MSSAKRQRLRARTPALPNHGHTDSGEPFGCYCARASIPLTTTWRWTKPCWIPRRNWAVPCCDSAGGRHEAASLCYSQKWAEVESLTALRPLVRRPTGGGLVPHDNDWTYSLVFPPEHFWYRLKAVESYQRVHEWLRDAFSQMNVATTLSPLRQKEIPGQCFIGAEKDDLLWHGRKIAGAAQRRTRNGLLVQGSVQPPPVSLSRERWEDSMCQVARERLGVEWKPLEPGAKLPQNLVESPSLHEIRAEGFQRKAISSWSLAMALPESITSAARSHPSASDRLFSAMNKAAAAFNKTASRFGPRSSPLNT